MKYFISVTYICVSVCTRLKGKINFLLCVSVKRLWKTLLQLK